MFAPRVGKSNRIKRREEYKLSLLETGDSDPLAVRQQHNLAEHSAFAQHLMGAARLL
jgi:hypothetical protein